MGESGPLPLSSILLPPGGWGFVSHHFAQLSADCWSLALDSVGSSPLSHPDSLLHGRWWPLAWGVSSSISCMARGCLARLPGSHTCSASLSSTWGPLKEHGAGLPAWSPQEKPGPGMAPAVNRSSQGAPESCAQTCGPCPTCGNPELPPALCPSCPGAGPLLSQHSLHSGLLSGCGLCTWCFLCVCGGACVLSTRASTYMSL